MSTTSIFDPDVDARGIWILIHRMAILSTTDDKKAQFINYMTFLSKEFPCEKCRVHIKQFIIENPFYLYMDVTINGGTDIGMFKWSYNFHNAVNSRLRKKLVDFNDAYNLYTGDVINVCSSKCDEEKKEEISPKKEVSQGKIMKLIGKKK